MENNVVGKRCMYIYVGLQENEYGIRDVLINLGYMYALAPYGQKADVKSVWFKPSTNM